MLRAAGSWQWPPGSWSEFPIGVEVQVDPQGGLDNGGRIDFLAVGHVTHDLCPGGTKLGGSVCYAGLTARQLGLRTALWTSHGPDFAHSAALAGLEVMVERAPTTTTFDNRYHEGERSQWVAHVAAPLQPARLPPALAGARVVQLSPVIDEVDLALAAAFPRAWVGLGVQGWIRQAAPDGRVLPLRWEPRDSWLEFVRLAVLSESEAAQQADLVPRLTASVPLVAVTRGARGSTLYIEGVPHPVAAVPAHEVDPTGAGDVYTAALLIRLAAGDDPLAAARFASAAASRIVEGVATANVGAISGLPLDAGAVRR